MIGLNVTRQVLADARPREQIRGDGPAVDHARRGHARLTTAQAEAVYTGLAGGAMHDPLAVAALADAGHPRRSSRCTSRSS